MNDLAIKFDNDHIKDIIISFQGKKILVYGDIMLDEFIFGEITRLSPEGVNAPIVPAQEIEQKPGGAGNTANNIVAFDAVPYLIGVSGVDIYQKVLLETFGNFKIDTTGIVEDSTRPTIRKVRIIGKRSGQESQIVRVDYEETHKISGNLNKQLIDLIDERVDAVDIVIVSDYAKGTVTQEVMDYLRMRCVQKNKRIIIDPKPGRFKNEEDMVKMYSGASLITPNRTEAYEMANISGESDSEDIDSEELVRKAGIYISDKYKCSVIITTSDKGMSIFERNRDGINYSQLKTKALGVSDVSGAGDTVTSSIALALVCGANLRESAYIGNHAAGIVCRKPTTATATIDELIYNFK